MAVRNLLWWRETQRDALARAVEAGLSSCGEAWGLPMPKPTVHACCWIDPTLAWQAILPDQGLENQVWLGYSAQLRKDLSTALFDDADGAALSRQVVEQALLRVSAALRGLLSMPTQKTSNKLTTLILSTPPADHAQAWSGSVQMVFDGVWQGMVLHLAPQLVSQRVQAWLATPTQEPAAEPAHKAARQQGQSAGQRTPIIHAIDSIAVPLYVSLADIKLDLGSLQSLTPGAVVRLTHALEQPFDVCTADGSIVCTGYLGQSAAHRALGLLSVSTSSKSQD